MREIIYTYYYPDDIKSLAWGHLHVAWPIDCSREVKGLSLHVGGKGKFKKKNGSQERESAQVTRRFRKPEGAAHKIKSISVLCCERFHQIPKGHAQPTNFSFINEYFLVSIRSNDFHHDVFVHVSLCFLLILLHSPLLSFMTGSLSSHQSPLTSHISVLAPFLFLTSLKILLPFHSLFSAFVTYKCTHI